MDLGQVCNGWTSSGVQENPVSVCDGEQTVGSFAWHNGVGRCGNVSVFLADYRAASMRMPGKSNAWQTIIVERGNVMNIPQGLAIGAVAAAMLLNLSACTDMSRRDKNTAIGAGAGAIGGAVLTGGSGVGTVGGAVVGGAIGHEVGKGR